MIAVARKGGIDIIANEASYRTTPALVTFGDTQRYIGQSAHAQFKRNVPTTVSNIKRLLGRKFNEEDVQKELPYLAYKIKALEDNEIGIELPTPNTEGNEVKTYTPVQICGALMGQLKRTAEESLQQEVRDVVIGVPTWWTDRQRRAMLDAAAVAGLNCLQLINELTACALELGIRKDRTLQDKESELVCFFDMGDTQTQCAVMRYSKGKLEVLGYAYDHHLGGRNFTAAIAEHFRKEWLAKYKIDVSTNARAKLRTTEACQALKHTLSANAFGNVNLDCLMQDKDVSGRLERDQFVEMVKPLLEQILIPVQRALESAGVKKEDIVSVEVVGDSHRIPAIGEKLSSFFGKPPSKRTNATEVVAKGAAWQCARRSPLFKVHPYELKDLQTYPIDFAWRWGNKAHPDGEGEPVKSSVFPIQSTVPLFKQVTFKKQIEEGFTFVANASYPEGTVLPAGTGKHLGRWVISSIPLDPATAVAGEKAAIKIGCKLDESGIVSVSRAEKEWNEEHEYEEEQEVPLTAEEEAAAAAAAPKPEEGKDGKPAEAKQPKTKKVKVMKKRVVARSHKLDVHPHTPSLSAETVRKYLELENEMRSQDKLVIETAAEKNKVEAYVYEAREKLSDKWSPFATEDVKSKLSALLESVESWLYDEGQNQTKSVYSSKLAEMKNIGDPIELRLRESEERGPSVSELKESAQQWLAWADTNEVAFDHIGADDRNNVKSKAKNALEWLAEVEQKQAKTAPTEAPAFLSADVQARKNNLDKECNVIKSKPKPKPKAPEPAAKPADPPKTEEKKEEEPAKPAEGPQPEPMDTSN